MNQLVYGIQSLLVLGVKTLNVSELPAIRCVCELNSTKAKSGLLKYLRNNIICYKIIKKFGLLFYCRVFGIKLKYWELKKKTINFK